MCCRNEVGETLRAREKRSFSLSLRVSPTPPSPLPLPFPEVFAPFRLKVALAPRAVIGFSLHRIRIARHLNKCTLTLVGAHFVAAFRKAWGLRHSIK